MYMLCIYYNTIESLVSRFCTICPNYRNYEKSDTRVHVTYNGYGSLVFKKILKQNK